MDESRITGCILGTAVGDALGLPYEGVSPKRLPRLLGSPDRYRFLFGRGMVSDDTEHVCMVAQSLISSGFELDAFTRDFARRLRWWFALLPAGIGRATLRACLKLWFGASPHSSGVFSAGNGPAMRAAIFGAVFDDLDTMTEFVRASTRITHSDPKAEYGAVAIALAAFFARRETPIDGEAFVDQLASVIGPEGEELIALLREVKRSVSAGESTLQYAAGNGLGRGVTGYTYHTVPVAIHAWLSHSNDFRAAVTCVIECGGDADTTAAIVGGIVGTATGESGIPSEWLSSLCEWPRSVRWMRRLAHQLTESLPNSTPQQPLRLGFVAVLLRNLLFLLVVLFHGFRRLFPPY
jgi:ADP-ribosylglycohydrolase